MSEALEQLELQEASDHHRIADLSRQALVLRAQIGQLTDEWREISAAFHRTTTRLHEAEASAVEAQIDFALASETHQRAAETYHRVSKIIILAAASEIVGEAVCGGATSTRAFREQLRAEGHSLDGVDVDHVWPRALGGVDHPLNYQVLESSLNRSLGAGVLDKFGRWPLATAQGLAVSAIAALRCSL